MPDYCINSGMAYNIATRLGVKKHLKATLYNMSKPYFENMQEGAFFCDDSPVSPSKIHIVKVSTANFVAIGPLLKNDDKAKVVTKSGKKFVDVDFGVGTLRFLETSKVSVRASDGETTAKQERASLEMVKRVLQENKTYNTPEAIAKDKPFFNRLIKVYPEINDIWLQGLHAQGLKIKSLYASSNFTEFNRDGGFMDFISNLIREKFGISKKDTWNPADIWMIKNEKKVRQQILESVSGPNPSMSKLNDTMRLMYKNKTLVGVSLKAVSGKTARWEDVNTVSNIPQVDKLKLDSIRMIMTSKSDGTLSTTDTVITVMSGTAGAKFQLRQNSKGFNNLKFEPTKIGAGASRLGKVPLDMLARLLPEYGIKDFKNNWRLYPQTADEFKDVQKKYADRFIVINRLKYQEDIDTDITNSQFIDSMTKSFKSVDQKNGVSTSKLQQLDFVYYIMTLKASERNELLTNMLYLAEKKGTQFAPFGKVY